MREARIKFFDGFAEKRDYKLIALIEFQWRPLFIGL